jgi:hypothetical protein
MAVNRKYIGFRLPPFTVVVDPARLLRFAEAIGARPTMAGRAFAPPTYLKVIEGEGNSSRKILAALGVDLKQVMHAEQAFEYGEPIKGGDRVTVERVVSDIYDRKEGLLEFIVVDSVIRHTSGALAGRTQQSILVRNRDRATPV